LIFYSKLLELSPFIDDDESIFWARIFNEDTIHGLLKNELTLFYHFHAKPKDCALPLTWQQLHETRFPNVLFVVWQIVGIPRSQI
jgi:hypothetical protein